VARPCLSGTAPVVTGLRVEGTGTGFLVDQIRLTSHHRRPERNPMLTCSRLFMTANPTCRLGRSASRRKRAETCWPMCGPSSSEAMRAASLSAGVAGEKKRDGLTPVRIPYFRSREGMETDDLLCSFDARNRGSTRLPLKVKWGIGTTRAVEDHSVPIPKEVTSKLGGIICNLPRRPQWD
jgi:hypothetical protein